MSFWQHLILGGNGQGALHSSNCGSCQNETTQMGSDKAMLYWAEDKCCPQFTDTLKIWSCFQRRCCGCCLRGSWPVGPVRGPVRHPAPAHKRGAAVCCVTEPVWLICPKSFPARPRPSTWKRTDSSSCRKGPLARYHHSSHSLWTIITFLLSRQEPSRSVVFLLIWMLVWLNVRQYFV